jgi:hypothetical protein
MYVFNGPEGWDGIDTDEGAPTRVSTAPSWFSTTTKPLSSAIDEAASRRYASHVAAGLFTRFTTRPTTWRERLSRSVVSCRSYMTT